MPEVAEVISNIRHGVYDAEFKRLYGDTEPDFSNQKARYVNTIKRFTQRYGQYRNISVYSTPGRSEICGNHTDHNNGLVLASAINLDTIAVVSQNNGDLIKVTSEGFKGSILVNLVVLSPQPDENGTSQALVRGVAAGIEMAHGKVGGFDAYTSSEVLPGSGLSSSAAFEVCIAQIINTEFNNAKFEPAMLAQIGQMAENRFFGKPSGLMDQLSSAVGGVVSIDFEDQQQPIVQPVELDLAKYDYKLVITNTGGSHANLTEDYAQIREEMEKVADFFGKRALRRVPEEDFWPAVPKIRELLGDRAVLRAIHFYGECHRVNEATKALKEPDFERFLQLVTESGHSSFEYNQNAYSLKHPKEQGVPLGLAISQKVLGRQGGYRLQGGGFAGTIQAFVPQDLLHEYRTAMMDVFGGKACYTLDLRTQGSVCLIPR